MAHLSTHDHLNPEDNSFTYRYTRTWMNLFQRLAVQEEVQFEEGYILEVGAGVHSPMGCQLIGIADNAAFCSAIEPGEIVADHWHHAASVGLLAQHHARCFSKSLQDNIERIIEQTQEINSTEEK